MSDQTPKTHPALNVTRSRTPDELRMEHLTGLLAYEPDCEGVRPGMEYMSFQLGERVAGEKRTIPASASADKKPAIVFSGDLFHLRFWGSTAYAAEKAWREAKPRKEAK